MLKPGVLTVLYCLIAMMPPNICVGLSVLLPTVLGKLGFCSDFCSPAILITAHTKGYQVPSCRINVEIRNKFRGLYRYNACAKS